MREFKTCVKCGSEYVLVPGKPGRVSVCARCGEREEQKRGVMPLVAIPSPDDETGTIFSLGVLNRRRGWVECHRSAVRKREG